MADPTEPDASGETAADEPIGPTGDRPARAARRRTPDGRTLAICALLGVIAALLTVLVASAFTSDDGDANDAMQLRDSEALLKVEMETVDGKPADLRSLHEDGTPMLVNLWQSSCVPCVEEMPMLEEARAANPDITFVGIATQDNLAKAKELAEQTGITYPWLVDEPGEFYFQAGAEGMPTTVILDGSGAPISTKTGAFTDADELQAFLDQAG